MAYCTEAEVRAEIQGDVVPASPSAGQVGQSDLTTWADQASADIDSEISNRYTTPITGTEALKVIKEIAITFVLWRYHEVTNVTEDLPAASDGRFPLRQSNIGQRYGSAKKKLKEIKNWTRHLVDAVETSEGGVLASPDPDVYCPTFEAGKTQW